MYHYFYSEWIFNYLILSCILSSLSFSLLNIILQSKKYGWLVGKKRNCTCCESQLVRCFVCDLDFLVQFITSEVNSTLTEILG